MPADLEIDAKADLSGLESSFVDYAAATGRVCSEVVREQAGLFVDDLIKVTPPFTTLNSLTDSSGAQKKIGEWATFGDIKRAFVPIEELSVLKNGAGSTPFAKRLAELIPQGGPGLELILRNAHIPGTVIDTPTEAQHNALRNRRGRIPKGTRQRYLVRKTSALKKFIKSKQALVGRAKAGWVAAARALGRSVPAYVARHASEGSVNDQAHGNDPFITITNSVPYIGRQQAEVRIVQIAAGNREQAIRRQLAAKTAGLWEKVRRKNAA